MKPDFHKTTVPLAAWQKVLKGNPSLPEPVVSSFAACYVADVDVAKRVLALLEERAGDVDVDRAIQRVRFPLEAKLQRLLEQHDDGKYQSDTG
jgi:hypothetical protein